ncbi:hypothetical protein HAZT_HAZT010211 [Hyalella azteca]|uniref:Homeobox domain-containing protein n=1 Tax=Hyalella azteca TaxID=294128 RepID=A0A6A0HCR7_HYAAZ|nr:hypothetical protein HAZT_HAZT010211 [Hyalella azteca]
MLKKGARRRENGAPAAKRKLGRNPRVPFSSCQLTALESRFRQSQYLSSCDVAELSALLQLTETRGTVERLRVNLDKVSYFQSTVAKFAVNCDQY